MADARRVLVIDGETETEEVLKAVFEPRGLQIDRVCKVNEHDGPPPPSLLVVDDEGSSGSSASDDGRGDAWNGVPRVVIGTVRLPAERDGCNHRFLAKPFQYPELIQAVESLLTDRDRAA